MALRKKKKYSCAYCGRELNKKECTKDHIIPTSRGGINIFYNKVIACTRCNGSKSNMFPLEWKEAVLSGFHKHMKNRELIANNIVIVLEQAYIKALNYKL